MSDEEIVAERIRGALIVLDDLDSKIRGRLYEEGELHKRSNSMASLVRMEECNYVLTEIASLRKYVAGLANEPPIRRGGIGVAKGGNVVDVRNGGFRILGDIDDGFEKKD